MLTRASLVPLEWSRHRSRVWRRFTSYRFAVGEHCVPIAGEELAQAALCLPLVFSHEGNAWRVMALLGLQEGKSLCVDDEGRWRGGYVPAALRSQPFGVQPGQPQQLCIDEDSPWLVDGVVGEPLFDEKGGLAALVHETHAFLKTWELGCRRLGAMAESLAKAEVLRPWQSAALADLPVLYRVDEARWNAMGDRGFLALRHRGVIPLVYAQLMSQSRLGSLLQRQSQPHTSAKGEAEGSSEVLKQWRAALGDEPEHDWLLPVG
ncbi:SapC family protein [Halomonas mongoliensis]|uniref:SapC family protein n=1 Tax=Halomonas mongoliensis TaxID=321265 RepID=UPI00403B25C5